MRANGPVRLSLDFSILYLSFSLQHTLTRYLFGCLRKCDCRSNRANASLAYHYVALYRELFLLESSNSVLQSLQSPLYDRYRVNVSVLRLDTIHPLVSGNKWYKLKPALAQAAESHRSILSFGGAWSNHIHALAYAGFCNGIETIGVIRGEPEYASNAMLSDARRWGMRLQFVDRATYRRRDQDDYQRELSSANGGALVVPEGGSTFDAVQAVKEIWQLESMRGRAVDLLLTAVGSGGTLAGLIAGAPSHTRILGVPVLKYDARMAHRVGELLAGAGYSGDTQWTLLDGGHRGGYARLDAELAAVIYRMHQQYELPLDPIYTARLVVAFNRLLLTGGVAPDSQVVLVHTGGLQGVRGLQQRLSALAPAFNGPLPV